MRIEFSRSQDWRQRARRLRAINFEPLGLMKLKSCSKGMHIMTRSCRKVGMGSCGTFCDMQPESKVKLYSRRMYPGESNRCRWIHDV